MQIKLPISAKFFAICTLTLLVIFLPESLSAQESYYFYVAAESEDEVALVEFDGEEGKVIQEIPVGVWPSEIEGPHGVTVSPDGKYWFVSMAHGQPYGTVYKYETGTNKLAGKTELGLFPATMEISSATGFLYAVNFNLHGDMVPSSVSVVDPDLMLELERIETGVMPHGSRLSPDGMRHYSVGMMDGKLYEINAATFLIERSLHIDSALAEYHKSMPADHHSKHHEGEEHSHHHSDSSKTVKDGHEKMHSGDSMVMSTLKPTWVVPHPSEPLAYVALNGADHVVEIDLQKWSISKTFKTGAGPYNLAIDPEGKLLVATYKSAGKVGVWDLEAGNELAVIENSRKVTHGVTISPDGKYAFVSVEGIGAEPGSVDIIDLVELERVAVVETGKQAGGIYFWKMDSSI